MESHPRVICGQMEEGTALTELRTDLKQVRVDEMPHMHDQGVHHLLNLDIACQCCNLR